MAGNYTIIITATDEAFNTTTFTFNLAVTDPTSVPPADSGETVTEEPVKENKPNMTTIIIGASIVGGMLILFTIILFSINRAKSPSRD
jgi:hypothetical protein